MTSPQARTHDQVFQEWKKANPTQRWSTHEVNETLRLLSEYSGLGFRLIPLGVKSKRPKATFAWADEVMNWQEVFAHIAKKGNIGVVAGLSRPKLIIVDYDSHEVPEQIEKAMKKTVSSISPNGYHIFTRGGPYCEPRYETLLQSAVQNLKERYPKMDLARAGNGYVVVPPSETCMFEHGKPEDHDCGREGSEHPRHEYRMHEWLAFSGSLMPFGSFVKLCLR